MLEPVRLLVGWEAEWARRALDEVLVVVGVIERGLQTFLRCAVWIASGRVPVIG